MPNESVHYRTCPLCEARCGIKITTEKETILSIAGDKEDPFSRGYVCPKAFALKDLHEDPERIRTPLERTADGWKEISWDDAYDKVIEGIQSLQKKYGKDSIGMYLGNPNVHNLGAMMYGSFFTKTLKSKNIFSATSVDQLPHHIVAKQLFGHQLKIAIPDIDNTDYFLIIGGNPLASNGSIMTVPDVKNRLKAIQNKGGKIVVIDPRLTETAKVANEHHFIKPGSDVLLLLAMINTMYAKNLTNPGRLKDITPDLDKVKEYTKAYSANKVAPIIGIKESEIVKLCEDFSRAKSGVIYGRLGVSVQEFGTLSQYLIVVLNILNGSLDKVGGLMFTKPAANLLKYGSPGWFSKHKTRVRGVSGFSGEYPVSTLAEEILTPGKGQIKGMVLSAGNPVLSTPNGNQLDKAFASLDFVLSVDFYITESSRHANIILPPTGPLERDHYDLVFNALAVRNVAKYNKAIFPPQGNTRHDWQIYLDLAARMKKPSLTNTFMHNVTKRIGTKHGLDLLLRSGHYGGGFNIFKGLSVKKLLKNPHGIDLGALKPEFPESIIHSDKKIHLEFDYFMTDLKRVDKVFFNDKKADADNILQLIGRRHVRSNNSWLHNSPKLVKGKQRCTAMINTDDAAALKISTGQQLKVTSRVGSIEIEAEITSDIMKGVISIPHGWGHTKKGTKWSTAEKHAGVSVNDLTDEMVLDDLSGNAVLNGVSVTIERL